MTDYDYDARLLDYITEYTEEVGVPPTVDLMLENVSGISSKSSVHYHLKKLVSVGLLVQKNVKGYYYPTSLDKDVTVTVPKLFLRKLREGISNSHVQAALIKELEDYINS